MAVLDAEREKKNFSDFFLREAIAYFHHPVGGPQGGGAVREAAPNPKNMRALMRGKKLSRKEFLFNKSHLRVYSGGGVATGV